MNPSSGHLLITNRKITTCGDTLQNGDSINSGIDTGTYKDTKYPAAITTHNDQRVVTLWNRHRWILDAAHAHHIDKSVALLTVLQNISGMKEDTKKQYLVVFHLHWMKQHPITKGQSPETCASLLVKYYKRFVIVEYKAGLVRNHIVMR